MMQYMQSPLSLLLPITLLIVTMCQCQVEANHDDNLKANPSGQKKLTKDPMFMTDLDLENLYDQWEEHDDDKLPPDELPPHKRPPKATFSHEQMEQQLSADPEQLMKLSKKGKTVMAFVTIDNEPSRQETETLTQRWQVGLTNNHMKCERFVIADNRAIFVFEDGSLAYEAKNFFIEQPELKEYSIDNRVWHGKQSLARNEECPFDPTDPKHSEHEACKKRE